MANMTVTLARNGTTLTFIPVPRIDEGLDKNLREKHGLERSKPVIQDHLQNKHTFVLTWEAVSNEPSGSGTAWAKKRALINYMQTTGQTWKLTLADADRGINETYYVVCAKIQCNDMAGQETSVRMIITFVETENWEGIS